MNDQSPPKLDVFRSLLAQAESLNEELSSLDAATRDRDAIKTRMGDCRDEDEARALLGELAKAGEVVTIKSIRAPRLRTDLLAIITEAEKACNDARHEVARTLTDFPRDAADSFRQLIREVQGEGERDRRSQATDQVALGVSPLAMAAAQQSNLSSASRSVGLNSETPERRLEGLQGALRHLDRANAAQDEILAEAKRLVAACEAFLKVFTKR
jgi:hypothetical protein